MAACGGTELYIPPMRQYRLTLSRFRISTHGLYVLLRVGMRLQQVEKQEVGAVILARVVDVAVRDGQESLAFEGVGDGTVAGEIGKTNRARSACQAPGSRSGSPACSGQGCRRCRRPPTEPAGKRTWGSLSSGRGSWISNAPIFIIICWHNRPILATPRGVSPADYTIQTQSQCTCTSYTG